MSSIQGGGQITERPPTFSSPIFWGLVLITAGLVALAFTLGLVPSPSGAVVGAVFAVVGLALLAAYLVVHAHWWTLIAGPTLLGLGGVIVLPGGGSGAILLGGIGLGFAFVALTGVKRWWAIIPAGTLLTLAVVALLGDAIGGLQPGGVLFLGLAVTFGVLAVIRVDGHAMRWPLFPALACLLLGLLLVTNGPLSAIIWPAALVAAGIFLLIRATTKRV